MAEYNLYVSCLTGFYFRWSDSLQKNTVMLVPTGAIHNQKRGEIPYILLCHCVSGWVGHDKSECLCV